MCICDTPIPNDMPNIGDIYTNKDRYFGECVYRIVEINTTADGIWYLCQASPSRYDLNWSDANMSHISEDNRQKMKKITITMKLRIEWLMAYLIYRFNLRRYPI